MFTNNNLLAEILDLPTYVKKPRGKILHLNLNNVLKISFRAYHKMKELYYESVKHKLPKIQIKGKVSLVFTLYSGDYREKDLSNMLCIIDKFMCDYLVKQKVLSNDNTLVIGNVQYRYGGVTKGHQHIDLRIYKEEEDGV